MTTPPRLITAINGVPIDEVDPETIRFKAGDRIRIEVTATPMVGVEAMSVYPLTHDVFYQCPECEPGVVRVLGGDHGDAVAQCDFCPYEQVVDIVMSSLKIKKDV